MLIHNAKIRKLFFCQTEGEFSLEFVAETPEDEIIDDNDGEGHCGGEEFGTSGVENENERGDDEHGGENVGEEHCEEPERFVDAYNDAFSFAVLLPVGGFNFDDLVGFIYKGALLASFAVAACRDNMHADCDFLLLDGYDYAVVCCNC